MDWKNKVVLVTGGTGSFGKAFAKTILGEQYGIKKLIIFSRDEMKQYEMRNMFEASDNRIRFFIGDVRDPDRLHRAFNGVDVVIHAAALKIVPTAEYNPFEAVKTNVIGAENIINMAIDNGVQRVIALSTDKAANPINLYGATKLCSEKMFVAGNNYSQPDGTRFSLVRYGNVLGSRGSVIPFFKECRKKGVVPITDIRMTRFWITLAHGVELVLHALDEMHGGEIFIPKLPSIRIVDVAEAICPGARHEIVGIRPGERLHETLVPADDGISTYEYEDKFVTIPQIVASNVKKDTGIPLDADFKGYRSDVNDHWFNVEEVKEMIEKDEANEKLIKAY